MECAREHIVRSSVDRYCSAMIDCEEKGASLVEHALALPVLLIFLVVSFDMLRLSYVALTSQFIATRVVREAVIGPAKFNIPPYNQAATPYTAYIGGEIIQSARRFGVRIAQSNISIECVAAGGCGGNPGQPGVLVVVELRIPTRVLLLADFTLVSTAVARNEVWSWQW